MLWQICSATASRLGSGDRGHAGPRSDPEANTSLKLNEVLSWNTETIVVDDIHDPHYLEYLR